MDTRLTKPRRENDLVETIEQQIAVLSRMTVGQLRNRYVEVFGEESRSNNRQFLFRRIAWRIQALAEGGLSERARRRALEIANDADLRVRAPDKRFSDPQAFLSVAVNVPKARDSRLPPPGSWLERDYRGRRIAIKVRSDGFEYGERVYKTLSAAVNAATGGRWNGFSFFGISSPVEVPNVAD